MEFTLTLIKLPTRHIFRPSCRKKRYATEIRFIGDPPVSDDTCAESKGLFSQSAQNKSRSAGFVCSLCEIHYMQRKPSGSCLGEKDCHKSKQIRPQRDQHRRLQSIHSGNQDCPQRLPMDVQTEASKLI